MNVLLYLISGTLLGYFCSEMAARKGRNPSTWFVLGAILGMSALLILFFLPSKLPIYVEHNNVEPANNNEIGKNLPEALWYYLDKEEKQYGPMSLNALREAWYHDRVTASTHVWNEKMDNWKTLEDLPETLEKLRGG